MPFVGHLPELIVVMLLALLIFGPKRLPEMGNAIGKTIKEFQHTMKDATKDTAAPIDRQLPSATTPTPVPVESPASDAS
jgi:sec-independent protein translocase protein TatA